MASANTQFSIAVHVLAAIANYESAFTSVVLAGGVNANPVFVKRILVKLSKAKILETTAGKSGGYELARDAKKISLLDVYTAVGLPDVFAIHAYPKKKWCVVSNHIQDLMGEIQQSAQRVIKGELKRITIADVVLRIKKKSQ